MQRDIVTIMSHRLFQPKRGEICSTEAKLIQKSSHRAAAPTSARVRTAHDQDEHLERPRLSCHHELDLQTPTSIRRAFSDTSNYNEREAVHRFGFCLSSAIHPIIGKFCLDTRV